MPIPRQDRDVQKNASRPSRDQDVRDRDYNPAEMYAILRCLSSDDLSYSTVTQLPSAPTVRLP